MEWWALWNISIHWYSTETVDWLDRLSTKTSPLGDAVPTGGRWGIGRLIDMVERIKKKGFLFHLVWTIGEKTPETVVVCEQENIEIYIFYNDYLLKKD